jgi:ribosomal protein S18 acetylase RimI-like enzyme
MMWVIRQAEQHDAAALAALAEQTFRETFGADNTAQDMDQHCAQAYGIGIQTQEILDPQIDTFVVEDKHELIAYAQLYWLRAPSCVKAAHPVEIRRFYVDSAWHGKGIANALMTALLEHVAAKNADQVWLGVWEHNPKARKFYQKMGFLEVGKHVFQLGNDPQRDLILSRKVEARFASDN